MNQDLVTIVLPIYNVKNYIDRCMESVVNQTYTNIEIIMVDDGSTDGCAEICDLWAKRDNRVVVVHKNNEGLGMARNTGIENAKGKYIVFFDSDDYVALNTIEECYKRAKEDNTELVTFGHSCVSSTGKIASSVIPKSERLVYRGNEICDTILKDLLMQNDRASVVKNMWMSAWSYFYSMDLIRNNGWKFVSERKIISEDIYSLLQLYSFVNSVSIVEKSLYFYCENATSLTHVFRADRFDKINIFYQETIEEAERLNLPGGVVDCVSYPYIANVIAMLKMLINSDVGFLKKRIELKKVCDDRIFLQAISRIDINKENRNRRILLRQIIKKHAVIVFVLVKLNELIK